MSRLFALVAGAVLVLTLGACGGGSDKPAPPTTVPATPTEIPLESYLVGKPQDRAGIGDVQRAFDRYEARRSDMIEDFKSQAWFKDGLTRDEALFVERSITFVARYSGPRTAYVRQESIDRKLYRYDRVGLSEGEIELLLIYEPGQDADREMGYLAQILPALESLVGVQFPEKVLTVINGDFEINDFNDGQFIRIARCCVTSPFILAHELAHAYWSMGPSWLNEGMADIHAVETLSLLNRQRPAGWTPVPADLDTYYRTRKAATGRFPDMLLPRRLASDGLYEVADVMLLDMRRVLGDDQFGAALRNIYLASDFGRYNLREKRIEDLFLESAPGDARQQIMDLFNRNIWGDNGERYQRLQELDSE